MKYLKTFESYSKKEIKEDDIYYKKFQSLTKSEINDIRKEWKELRHEALKNLNDELHKNDKSGSIGGTDVEDVDLYKYLKGENLKKFKEASRILDFESGYSKKKLK
jgi:ArsR family metal-binding transcriptional regulator